MFHFIIKVFTQINIHSKQQQVEVPLINVFFMLVPVLNAPEYTHTLYIIKIIICMA